MPGAGQGPGEAGLVLIGHSVTERRKPQGKLLPDIEDYRFQAIVTSIPVAAMDATVVYRSYLPRGEFENRTDVGARSCSGCPHLRPGWNAFNKRWRGSYPFHPTAERCWNRRPGSLILNRRYRLMDESSKAWPCLYPVCIPVHPVHPRQNQTLGASARPSPEVHHHPWLYLAGDEQDGRGCKTDKTRSCLAKPRLSKFELPKHNCRIRAQEERLLAPIQVDAIGEVRKLKAGPLRAGLPGRPPGPWSRCSLGRERDRVLKATSIPSSQTQESEGTSSVDC